MNALMRWSWPGNIRELENFIERSVILTEGSVLQSPIAELAFPDQDPTADLQKREREHIANILRESRGNVAIAAARLGLKRTTLQSKIHRLGLKHDVGGHRFPRAR